MKRFTSKPQLQPELDDARATARPRDLPEACAADVTIRIPERRSIRDVVGLDSKLHRPAFHQAGRFGQAEIETPLIGSDDGVPPQIAERYPGALERIAVQIVVETSCHRRAR